MTLNIKLAIQIAIGITGYATWAAMAYHDPALRPDFLHFNILMATGTIGLALRDMKPGASENPTDSPPRKETP